MPKLKTEQQKTEFILNILNDTNINHFPTCAGGTQKYKNPEWVLNAGKAYRSNMFSVS